jgi:hypothetical protein
LLGIGCDHENSVKNHYFMKMTTNECILDDFRHKSYQKQSVESLKVAFRPLYSHFDGLKTVKKVLYG